MFRTRDFVLIFTTVLFLLMAIGTTLWNQYRKDAAGDAMVITRPVDGEFISEVELPVTESRADRLASMREKIAADAELALTNDIPDITESPEPDPTDTVEPADVVMIQEELRCPDYAAYSGAWSPAGLEMEMVEGSRLIFRSEMRTVQVGTSTEETLVKVPVLQLPAQLANPSNPRCIPSDVIGVALDGSLIRNSERSLYGVFGYETLIGYALDGFPIYGTGATPLDQCGGSNIAGQYRYFVQTEHATIINCFVAKPASL